MSLLPEVPGMREADAVCGDPHSPASKRLVVQLSEDTLETKEAILFGAVERGLSNIVRCALEAKVSPNTRGSDVDRPVLVQAAFSGYTHVLKLLLDAGADHGLMDKEGSTSLHASVSRGYMDCVKLLLAAGADANKAGAGLNDTPLMVAIMHRQTECAQILLPSSDLLAKNSDGQTALHICALGGDYECFKLLLPLMSDVDVLTEAPRADAPPQPTSIVNLTALHCACMKGQQEMAKALLKRGANRMAREGNQRTSLHWACQEGHLACVVLLIGQKGRYKLTPADVNAVDARGATALHLAAEKGHEKTAGVLLEAGARLDVKTADGRFPLMLALQMQPTNSALLALLSGAGPAQPPGTVCDHCGKTAAQASVNNLKGCEQCQAVRYCCTACQLAAWRGHKKACRARAAEREAATTAVTIKSFGAAGQAAPNN